VVNLTKPKINTRFSLHGQSKEMTIRRNELKHVAEALASATYLNSYLPSVDIDNK